MKNSKYQLLVYIKGFLVCLEFWHFEFFFDLENEIMEFFLRLAPTRENL